MFSSPARPAGSAPPSFPSSSAPAIRSSGSPARMPRPPPSPRPGREVQRGTLDDLDSLRSAAAASDGVIHLAFKHDIAFSGDFQGAADADRRAIETFGEALAGSDRPFVIASGTLGLAPGRVATERDGRSPTRRRRSDRRSGDAAGHCAADALPRLARRPLVRRAAPPDRARRRRQRLHGDHRRHRPRQGRLRLHRRRVQPLARRAPARCRPPVPAGRWRTPRRDRHCTRSPTRACRSATSPR